MVYAPGTLETDPKKQNMALQQQASAIKTATNDIAANTADIVALEAAVAALPTSAVTNVGTAGLATGGPITSTGTVTVTASTQSDQETATSTSTAVTPGRQHFHPSAAKAWAYCTISGTTLTNAATYNMTVTRTGVGTYTVAFGTNFSSANYAVVTHADRAGNIVWATITSQSASALAISAFNAPSFVAVEATSLTIVCFGDQ